MIETYYPEMIPHLSSCKSPQNMTGALLKSHYAEMNGIDPKDLVVVSVMPCTAKKYEVQRDELSVDGNKDVDISITTRELARMIKEARLDSRHCLTKNLTRITAITPALLLSSALPAALWKPQSVQWLTS